MYLLYEKLSGRVLGRGTFPDVLDTLRGALFLYDAGALDMRKDV